LGYSGKNLTCASLKTGKVIHSSRRAQEPLREKTVTLKRKLSMEVLRQTSLDGERNAPIDLSGKGGEQDNDFKAAACRIMRKTAVVPGILSPQVP